MTINEKYDDFLYDVYSTACERLTDKREECINVAINSKDFTEIYIAVGTADDIIKKQTELKNLYDMALKRDTFFGFIEYAQLIMGEES